MNFRRILLTCALAIATSAVALFTYHHALRPATMRFATLDVAELYHLKEAQIATVLVKRDATDEERLGHLKHAADFSHELSAILRSLPQECGCIVLTRGAVIGANSPLPDLTAEVRRRLGL